MLLFGIHTWLLLARFNWNNSSIHTIRLFYYLVPYIYSSILFFKYLDIETPEVVQGPIDEDLETTALLQDETPAATEKIVNRNRIVKYAMIIYAALISSQVIFILVLKPNTELRLFYAGSLGIISVLTGVFLINRLFSISRKYYTQLSEKILAPFHFQHY